MPVPKNELEARYGFHKLTEEQQDDVAKLRRRFLDLAREMEGVLEHGREKALMHTNLEQAETWAVKSYVRGTL